MQKDRARLEQEIMRFSEDRTKTGIWISTQIVEASLDIDFDFLYTEMCTADSLLQRMGRCFRKRVYEKEEHRDKNGNMGLAKSLHLLATHSENLFLR